MNRPREEIGDARKIRAKELSAEITERFDFLTLMQSGEMYVRDGGVYRDGIGETVIEGEVEREEPNESNQFAREVIGHVRRSTFSPDDVFDKDLNIINLENGLYRLNSGTLTAHDPVYISRIQLPVRYDLKAAPVKIMRFLKEVLPNPDDLVNVLEDAASCLVRDARFQKAYMYIGKGANGKSVWLRTLNLVLGKRNVDNASIHELGMSRFGAGNLEGKLAVIYPDISANEITLTGKLKAIIDGSEIDVEKKGVQGHPITPYAKLFFSANTLPVVADDSDAWFRHWRITNWEVQIDAGQQNPNLLAELTDPKELSGLFNVLAAFARRLVAQNGFSYNATIHQNRSEWGNRANVIRAFVSKCLTVQKDGGPSLTAISADVYAEYVKFCLGQNFTPKKQTGFMEELKTIVPIKSTPQRIGKKVMQVINGVELKGVGIVGSVDSVGGSISRLIGTDYPTNGSIDTPNTPYTPNNVTIERDSMGTTEIQGEPFAPIQEPQPAPVAKSIPDPERELWWWCSKGDAGGWGPGEKGLKIAKEHRALMGEGHEPEERPAP